MKKIIVALDQGTSSSRAIAFDDRGVKIAESQKEFTQIFPKDGWVEHDPEQIWQSQYEVLCEVLHKVGPQNVEALGITNQRETVIVWDARSGKPIYNAIVWQDRRTAGYCSFLESHQHSGMIREKTGLKLDPYFSATKLKWILDNVPGARQKAGAGELRFGTVDTYLLWRLTAGRNHATDYSNASRTMLFNIHSLEWDKELLSLFDIPAELLPEIYPSSHFFGTFEFEGSKIPICSIIGDQQSALFGQLCLEKGDVKNTYGTGCFLLMNTGDKLVKSKNGLLSTIAWGLDGKVTYALEGSVFVAGAVVQWLRDGIGIIKSSAQVEELASSVENSAGVYFVPALTGLGAPYWNPQARGTIVGLSRGTTAAHIARAALEGIAFEVMDMVKLMETESQIAIHQLKVDGGAAANGLLLQIQADLLDTQVIRPVELETTALGAAYMAGLQIGMWKSVEELKGHWQAGARFAGRIGEAERQARIENWHKAIKKTLE